jgi:diadenosine tetraphosphatase ApaH/serine/threonine PP2A family protein phosphatase
MKSKSTDALTDAMPRTKKSSAKKRVEPPPDASLLGIAPELRNNIYHMVAQDIEEVSILSRKIGFGAASAEDRLWDIVAKHPLSQTCSQLRQEFDPIHRRKAITVGVTRYRLEVPNYDVYRLREFARLLKQVPSFVPQIRASVKVDRVLVRFQLDSNLKSSLDRIRQDLLTPDRLRKPFLKLRDHFLGESDDYDNRYDWDLDNRWYWWQGRCVVKPQHERSEHARYREYFRTHA